MSQPLTPQQQAQLAQELEHAQRMMTAGQMQLKTQRVSSTRGPVTVEMNGLAELTDVTVEGNEDLSDHARQAFLDAQHQARRLYEGMFLG